MNSESGLAIFSFIMVLWYSDRLNKIDDTIAFLNHPQHYEYCEKVK